MSATSTPKSEPAAPPPAGLGADERTPIVPASVNDMFDLAAPPVEAPLVARLVPVTASGGLSAIALLQDQGTQTLGRSKELPAPFRIDHIAKLSAKHCDITLDPVTLRVTLRDRSANGTFVNGERVEKNTPVTLHAGDTVSLVRPATGKAAEDADQADFIFQRIKEETDVKTMMEELTCGVCLQIYLRPVSLIPCMHVFCASCISRWLREGKTTCPECCVRINEVRPTHKIQSCVTQLLLADPSKQRPHEEILALEAEDDIPPAGKVLRKRGRGSGGDSDDGSTSSQQRFRDEHGSPSDESGEDSDDANGGLLNPNHRFGGAGTFARGADKPCPQCAHPSTFPDHFQCPEGGAHLACNACRITFPERPLCGRPQRCHLCSAPYCGLYFEGEKATDEAGNETHMPKGCARDTVMAGQAHRALQPVTEARFTLLPPNTFRGNTVEQSILTTYLASRQISVAQVWQVCLEKLRDGTWKPDLSSVNGPVTSHSAVCHMCCAKVFAALLFHYRRAIPASELPESVTNRPNCWHGLECRTQFKPDAQHAQRYNHVCYQEKRKE